MFLMLLPFFHLRYFDPTNYTKLLWWVFNWYRFPSLLYLNFLFIFNHACILICVLSIFIFEKI